MSTEHELLSLVQRAGRAQPAVQEIDLDERLHRIADSRRRLVEIGDDGQGIQPTKTESQRLGLMGIRERAHRHGGHLELLSGPDEQGTTLRLHLPYAESLSDQR